MKRKIIILICILLVIILVITGIIMKKKNDVNKEKNNNEISYIDNKFNINLIKAVNNNNQNNYLISPYSIEIALSMLRDGAKDNTLKEIENVIGNRNISDVIVKDHIGVANAAFIKNKYKNYLLDEFKNNLESKYHSEILYDDFKTPKVINDWVNDKTNGMIKDILSDIDEYFVLGLANALAIDVEWNSPFDCSKTVKEHFTKIDKKNIYVEMMHKTLEYSGYKYLKNDNATGVIIPYKKYNKNTGEEDYENGSNLEFIGILPNDNIYDYINNVNEKELNNLLSSSREVSDNFEIELGLPRFKYDYELNNFMEVLKNMGIKDAFDRTKANFTKIMPRNNEIENLYVDEAIHKTHIELNEKGTKAAAVTFFGFSNKAMMPEEKEKVSITFNKPFIYIIRDSSTNEMLFFGTVYEPNIWNGSTCSE